MVNALPKVPRAWRPRCRAVPAAGDRHTRHTCGIASRAAAAASPPQPPIPAQPTQGRAVSQISLFLPWILSPAPSTMRPGKWRCWQSSGMALGPARWPHQAGAGCSRCPGLTGGTVGILIALRGSLSSAAATRESTAQGLGNHSVFRTPRAGSASPHLGPFLCGNGVRRGQKQRMKLVLVTPTTARLKTGVLGSSKRPCPQPCATG